MCGSHSSGSSTALQRSVSAVSDEQQMTSDLKQRKRKLSNRESARRSRMRKQSHLDGLQAQANQLSYDNANLLASLNLTRQMCINVEGENSVLRAQMAELTHRLNSLNEIIFGFNQVDPQRNTVANQSDIQMTTAMMNWYDFLNPYNMLHVNQPYCAENMLMN